MKPKARKSRKRKFLSLRLQLGATGAAADDRKPAMNLFPLQPDDKDHDNSVAARFFAAADGGAATLTGILPAAEGASPDTESAASLSSASFSVPSSMVRAALRSREREEEEEGEKIRWVRMSEVVDERKTEEEVSSRAEAEEWWLARRREGGSGEGLALKLDYKEVLEAWCGKGRPFWRGECPQTVPDLQLQDDLLYHDLNAANGGLWRVPNQKSCVHHGGEAIEGWKVGQRQASVLRYKEKRMNRLFSKRIRYQVRKLNAEKRPRVKGRFVKRS